MLVDAFVFVVVAVVGTGLVAPLQETVHFVLVQTHRADVRVHFFIPVVKFAAFAIHRHVPHLFLFLSGNIVSHFVRVAKGENSFLKKFLKSP